jgi:hypothetical protein
MKAYNSSSPKRIGVVIGYDIKASTHIIVAEEMIRGPLIDPAVIPAKMEKWMNFKNDVTNSIWDHIKNDMERKNYSVQLTVVKPKEWKAFENTSDNPEVYPRLVNYYQLGDQAKNYDAILFVHVFIEVRIWERDNIESFRLDNMKMMYAKSRMFLYETANGKRIFYDLTQKGYSSISKTRLSEALNSILVLESIPSVSNQ